MVVYHTFDSTTKNLIFDLFRCEFLDGFRFEAENHFGTLNKINSSIHCDAVRIFFSLFEDGSNIDLLVLCVALSVDRGFYKMSKERIRRSIQLNEKEVATSITRPIQLYFIIMYSWPRTNSSSWVLVAGLGTQRK
jgi:hypothetical protein